MAAEHLIHQEQVFAKVAPARVFEALTDSKKFSAMSGGAPTEIDAKSGGAFSCFGGMILGRTIELVPGQRLVQAWRVKAWEPGQYSLVRFELKQEGEGTRVVLDHSGFPEGQGKHLGEGWNQNYWEPMKKAFS